MIKRLEALISDITGLSITESFAMMTEQGSRPRFRRALLETANYLVLEDTAGRIIRTPGNISQPSIIRQQQENIRLIARDTLRSGKIIKIDEAKPLLIKASVGILRVTDNARSSIIKTL